MSIAACAGNAPTAQPISAAGLPVDLRPAQNPHFTGWAARSKPRAASAGISSATLDAAFADAGYLPGVVTRDGNQIQTRRTLEEYLSIAASDERIQKGRAAFSRHAATLTAIQTRYGVDAHIVAAIWGMESQFGEKRGQIPVVSSTATWPLTGGAAISTKAN